MLNRSESSDRFMLAAYNAEFTLLTKGKGTHEVTQKIGEIVRASKIQTGLATVFIRHTGASLIIFENADVTARLDLDAFFDRLVPEDTKYFSHTMEGPDDMPSHIRTVLTRSSESIPVRCGELQLGTWQGIFVYEHRRKPQQRSVAVSVLGDCH
jgi:secondary thiamine-phosphate synthase enzyme